MAFGFNPFTGNFDLTGGGDAAPFAGQVDAYADLPLDSTAALNSRWLVKNNSGTWPFSTYKQAGIYIRVNTAGASRDTDYQFVGTLPSVMNDNEFIVYNDTDATKNLKFQLSGITTGTTRTLTVPNSSGTVSLEGHTHAAAAITSGTLNFNRVMQQVSIESSGTELSPDVLDLTSNIVGGNLHALAIILSAVPNAYTEVVLPDLGASALGVVTVRPNFFEDPSANFLKVTNGTNNIWPAPPSTFIEMDDNEEVTFRWNQGKWDMDIRPNPAATAVPVQIFKPNTSGTLGLSEPTDSTFRIVGSSDATKKVAFEVDGLTAATTRTLTVPNASGILAINPMTTAGDIVVGGTSGAPARLALGAASQQLRVNSGATALEYFTPPAELVIACSDETSNLTTGTAKVTFRMPYAMTLSSVRASVNTAPTGSTLIVDINEGGSTILSTKLSIDASELTSTTAATAAVISDTALADDAEITIDIDQIGSTIAGKGLKVVLKGTRA